MSSSALNPFEDSSIMDPLISPENSPRASTVKPPSQPPPQPPPPTPGLAATSSSSSSGVTILSPADLAAVRRAIGAPPSRFEQPSTESRARIHQRVPEGLYKKTLERRREAQFSYYFTTTLYNTCLVLQVLLGAALTALGSSSTASRTAITLLAAANTVNAGLAALLHNSGLPARIRSDWNEYDKVELFLVALMDTGVVPAGAAPADVVRACFLMYAKARATVERNKPGYYAGASPGAGAGGGASSGGASAAGGGVPPS